MIKRLRRAIRARLFPDRARFVAPPAGHRDRSAAWIDFLLVDFAILRLFWKNRAQIAPRAWRMNQPFPSDIAWAKRQGIRTIVTARHDPRHGGNALVAEACARHGLAYVTFPLFSRAAPSRESLLAAEAFFSRAEYPLLLHCKSGADRAGMLAALFLIVAEGVPVSVGRWQLTLRHLHIRQSKTGVLDQVFDAYLAAHPDEAKPFLDWVRDEYDPEAVTRAHRASGIADIIDRVILRRE